MLNVLRTKRRLGFSLEARFGSTTKARHGSISVFNAEIQYGTRCPGRRLLMTKCVGRSLLLTSSHSSKWTFWVGWVSFFTCTVFFNHVSVFLCSIKVLRDFFTLWRGLSLLDMNIMVENSDTIVWSVVFLVDIGVVQEETLGVHGNCLSALWPPLRRGSWGVGKWAFLVSLWVKVLVAGITNLKGLWRTFFHLLHTCGWDYLWTLFFILFKFIIYNLCLFFISKSMFEI